MMFGFRAERGSARARTRKGVSRFMGSLEEPRRFGREWETTKIANNIMQSKKLTGFSIVSMNPLFETKPRESSLWKESPIYG
jgi:hypothetical protein